MSGHTYINNARLDNKFNEFICQVTTRHNRGQRKYCIDIIVQYVCMRPVFNSIASGTCEVCEHEPSNYSVYNNLDGDERRCSTARWDINFVEEGCMQWKPTVMHEIEQRKRAMNT